MAKKSLRIVIPTNVGDMLQLGERIYEKHQSDGTKSPLNSMQDYNWDTVGPNIIPAIEKHKEAETLQKQSEKAYAERDALVTDIKGMVTSSRDVLKGTFSKSPKNLGDWGYTVEDSPRAKVIKTIK